MSYTIKVQFYDYDPEVVKAIVNVRTRMANYLLNDRGYLFLNDVLVIFEAKPTYRGIFEGWIHAYVPCNQVGDPHVTIDLKKAEDPYEYELTFNCSDIVTRYFVRTAAGMQGLDAPLGKLVEEPNYPILNHDKPTKPNIEEKTDNAI